MPVVNKSLTVPYTAEQMYNLVNDIEDYPQFLPWCAAIQVHSKTDTQIEATLQLSKGPINHKITTLNTMQPHTLIAMEYVAGPFRNCKGLWRFIETQNKHCEVVFEMEYQFKNRLSALAIEPLFNPIANSLIDAFYKRAEQVYAN